MKTGIYWQDPKYVVGRRYSDPSCVLYLPLHRLDGASFMSKDAYGHLCTVTGALWRPNGRWFDGLDDKITVPDHAALDITVAITMEVWTKFDTVNFNANDSIISKGSRAGATTGYNFYPDAGNNLWMGMALDGTWTSGKIIQDLSQDTWYHLVAVYDGSNYIGYKNGAVQLSPAKTGAIVVNDIDVSIMFGGSAYMNGNIGEIRIYNRALTPLEIQGNYLATKRRYR